jgi:hypothetical protein
MILENLIYEDYKLLYQKYNEKFGDKICVLLQKESTYELYLNIDNISKILNLRVTTTTLSFPTSTLTNAIPLLLSSLYTVIILKKITEEKLDISAIYFPENVNFGGFVF